MPTQKTTATKKTAAKKTPRRTTEFHDRICNVVPSKDTDTDFSFESGVAAGVVAKKPKLPASVDLRAPWWTVNDQGFTGSCVGWATADGVVRWHMQHAGKLDKHTMLSPRHVWMASKETDSIRGFPETFIEEAGTMIKNAAHVAQKYGVALETDLPFDIKTAMYTGDENTFYTSCARHRIATYHNLKRNLDDWKAWLAQQGPILVALNVDASWDDAGSNHGKIDDFQPGTVRGGHAVAVVGYRRDGRFIVRNSWGTTWGDKGFGYVSPNYVQAAFYPESYGVTL